MTSRDVDAGALVQSLTDLTRRFDRGSSAKKIRLLAALKTRPIRNGALLRQLHDALCFMRAYPDDAAVLDLVEQSLAAFPTRLAALRDCGAQDEAAELDGSGVAGSSVRGAFSLSIARWLVDRFPEAVEIDWDQPETEDCVGCVFSMLSGPSTEEPLVEADTAYRSWVELHKANRSISDLRWLLDLLEERIPDGHVRRAFFDRLRLFIRWEMREGDLLDKASAGPGQPAFFQSGPWIKPGVELPQSLPGESITVRRAAATEAIELIALARKALALRHRETHAFNYGNPRDVQVATLGRGIEIAWIGVVPEHRLPLRALFGLLILKNGVPIGYGDAAPLFDWIEGGGGINIFEKFRQGEAVFIFHRYVAFLHQHLGIRALHGSRWDIGFNNPEGIESGAFWFYHRLGFRPKDDGLRRLAGREFGRIGQQGGYRSSKRTLEKLSRTGTFLSLENDDDPMVEAFETRRVTQQAAALSARVGPMRLTADVANILGVENWESWGRADRLALERLAPVLALIEDLEDWPASERRSIVSLVRAKAGPRETEYLRRLALLPRLRAAILGLGAPQAR